jgi:hypothetical protein
MSDRHRQEWRRWWADLGQPFDVVVSDVVDSEFPPEAKLRLLNLVAALARESREFGAAEALQFARAFAYVLPEHIGAAEVPEEVDCLFLEELRTFFIPTLEEMAAKEDGQTK